MRYTGWRKLRGDVLRRPDLIDVGKKLLAGLAERRNRGAPPTLVRRVTLPDGSVVEAGFTKNHPYINVHPAGTPVLGKETFTQYIAAIEYDVSQARQHLVIYRMGVYANGGDATPVEIHQNVERVASMPIDGESGTTRNTSVNANGDKVQFTTNDDTLNIVDISKIDQPVLAFSTPISGLPIQTLFAGDNSYVETIFPGRIYGIVDGAVASYDTGIISNAEHSMFATLDGKFAVAAVDAEQSIVFERGQAISGIAVQREDFLRYQLLSHSGKCLYAAGSHLEAYAIGYSRTGVPTTATQTANVSNLAGASLVVANFARLALSPSGKKLYAGLEEGGLYNRRFFFQFDVERLQGSLDLTEGNPAVRRIRTDQYRDADLIGVSGDGKTAYVYGRTYGGADMIAVIDVRTGATRSEIAAIASIAEGYGPNYAVNAVTFSVRNR